MAEFSDDKYIIESEGWRFEDSIVMPIDQYNALSSQDKENMKKQRFINYRQLITHPVQPTEELIPVIPDDELQAQAEEVLLT
jgi:hypothetical protein